MRQDKGVLTEHTAEIENYLRSLVEQIEIKYGVTVKPQTIPFLTESKIKTIQEDAEANKARPVATKLKRREGH